MLSDREILELAESARAGEREAIPSHARRRGDVRSVCHRRSSAPTVDGRLLVNDTRRVELALAGTTHRYYHRFRSAAGQARVPASSLTTQKTGDQSLFAESSPNAFRSVRPEYDNV